MPGQIKFSRVQGRMNKKAVLSNSAVTPLVDVLSMC